MAYFCKILQVAVSNYWTLISSGLFPELPKIWKENPLKLNYGLLQILFLVIDESTFWTWSDLVLPITLISGLAEERGTFCKNQTIFLQKKVNNALKKTLT